MAKRLAEKGYTVLMPNVFYRTTKPPVIDVTIGMGDARTMQRFGELRAPMTPEAVERDATAYVNFLAAHDGVSAGVDRRRRLLLHGRVWRCAPPLRCLAKLPRWLHSTAAVSTPMSRRSPHLVLPRIKARLYFGHATKDRSMPQEAIEKFDRALAAWGGKYESEVYEGAFHGWTTSDAPVYNQPQADRAFEKLTELFAGTLK